ncbi:MAG TPA: methyltransferase domain-containing protein [Patescibacteria group bacterium]|nr:methyltransferase domain-containing protein [Patescibacteria group bacterium]
MKNYNTQVKTEHYDFENYAHLERWISYFHQIDQVRVISRLLNKPSLKILEIGPGDGIVTVTLKKMGMNVKTMDIDKTLNPDYVSGLPDLKLKSNEKFDCVICCEVLEHIKYPDVKKSLKNISEIAEFSIISVPHASLTLSLSFKFIYLKAIKLLFSQDLDFRTHKFDGQHYWELGYKGFSSNGLKKVISNSGFELINEFRVSELPYHHFFILRRYA